MNKKAKGYIGAIAIGFLVALISKYFDIKFIDKFKNFSSIFFFLFFIIILIFLSAYIFSLFSIDYSLFRYFQKNNYGDALSLLLEKRDDGKKTFIDNFRIGYCYYMLGFNNNAINYLKKTINLNPNIFLTYYYLALIFALDENKDEAFKNLKLAESLIDKKKFRSFLIKKNILLDFEVKIWTLYTLGEKEVPINFYKKIATKYENSKFLPDGYYHLGIFFKDENQIEKAKKYFKLTIENGKDSIFVDKAKQELEKLK